MFNADFAGDLKEMAKFRNRLIHLYMEVNDELVHDILQSRLDDFKSFMDAVAVFLKLDEI